MSHALVSALDSKPSWDKHSYIQILPCLALSSPVLLCLVLLSKLEIKGGNRRAKVVDILSLNVLFDRFDKHIVKTGERIPKLL
jgi:hypothetical protein